MKRPLMGAGIALVVGVAAALLGVSWLWICLCIVGLNIAVKLWTEGSLKYVLGLSAFLVVGFCRTLPNAPEEAGQTPAVREIQGRICRVQEKANSTWLYMTTDENDTVLVVQVGGTEDRETYYKGQIVKVSGEAEAFIHPGNPGQFDEKSYYISQGVTYRLWAEKIIHVHEGGRFRRLLRRLEKLKERMVKFYRETMGESGAGVLMAAVLGDRSGFQDDLRRYYQENGWMHLVTTSGLHLSFIAMGLYRKLRKSTVAIWPSTAAALLMMLAYGYMTDFGDSMLRAMGMMVFLLIGKLLGRKMDVPTSLVLTADILLMLRPERLMSAGFQLSFGAVAGMELGKYFVKCFWGEEKVSKTRNKNNFWRRSLKKFQETLWVQLGIFLVTLPILLWHMYEVPLLGFFYNFFMIPLISFIVPLSFLTGFIGISKFPILVMAASKVMWGIDVLLGQVHKLPSAVLICGKPQWWQLFLFCICVCSAIFLASRKPIFQKKTCRKSVSRKDIFRKPSAVILHVAMILSVGCFILMLVRERSDRILCLDLGQGDGICILGENGQAVLVDGGSSDVKKVYQYRIESTLKYYGIRKIDAWFLTHGDSDHVSGIEEAFKDGAIPVRRLILPDVSTDETLSEIREMAEQQDIPVMTVRPGDQLKAGNFELSCLYPKAEWCSGDKNNDSLVLSLSRTAGTNHFTMLLMGDLEKQGEALLLEKNGVTDCDVLKVGHHGSSGATSKVFLEAAAPEWAFISCGEDNRYGHPHDETLERLRMTGCEYLTTAGHGALMIRFSSNTYHVLVWGKGVKL